MSPPGVQGKIHVSEYFAFSVVLGPVGVLVYLIRQSELLQDQLSADSSVHQRSCWIFDCRDVLTIQTELV